MAVNLDRKVQFRRRVGVNGPLGMEYTWSDHGPRISASRRDISDAEKVAAGQVQATIFARFIVRSTTFTRELSPIDRLTHGGRDWDIQGIKEANLGRHAFLEITATARADV